MNIMETFNRCFLKRCPRSKRIVGIRKSALAMPLFPLIGIAALIWFLLRVVPKPSRIEYPCQKVAAPIAFSLVSSVVSYFGLVSVYKKTRTFVKERAFTSAFVSGIVGLALFAIVLSRISPDTIASDLFAPQDKAVFYTPIDAPNQPMGIGKGIFPGRVVWMRDTSATRWDADTINGHWWDDLSTDQKKVDRMISQSLWALTGADNDTLAWLRIFRHYNQQHGRGNRGYESNEKIAIKINCNNAYAGYRDSDNQIDASKQTILSLLRQLIDKAGVPQQNVVLYEAVRVIPDRIYGPCHAEFPDVLWMDSKGDSANGRIRVQWRPGTLGYSDSTRCGTAIPQMLYDATYLINMSLLKAHVSLGITLTAKNHYGSIDKRDHRRFDPGSYDPLVDIIGSKHVGQKTILYVIDGLYGIRDVNDPVTKEFAAWNNLFHGQWLSSIFMSQDPIAIDAVGYDFLRSEFGERLGRGKGMPADTYMHEAALADNPPSHTIYKPDGVPIASLGVHEHWNNAAEKMYSRNLSPQGKGIELFRMEK
ncbi:MAG: DUF362 domain-containing protein [Ignavibacteriales bacterium]|nr:DUF362 domain-containing protein [Ignavibacteriales bacterium]